MIMRGADIVNELSFAAAGADRLFQPGALPSPTSFWCWRSPRADLSAHHACGSARGERADVRQRRRRARRQPHAHPFPSHRPDRAADAGHDSEPSTSQPSFLPSRPLSFLGLGIQALNSPGVPWSATGRGYLFDRLVDRLLAGLAILVDDLSLNILSSWWRTYADPQQRWRNRTRPLEEGHSGETQMTGPHLLEVKI